MQKLRIDGQREESRFGCGESRVRSCDARCNIPARYVSIEAVCISAREAESTKCRDHDVWFCQCVGVVLYCTWFFRVEDMRYLSNRPFKRLERNYGPLFLPLSGILWWKPYPQSLSSFMVGSLTRAVTHTETERAVNYTRVKNVEGLSFPRTKLCLHTVITGRWRWGAHFREFLRNEAILRLVANWTEAGWHKYQCCGGCSNPVRTSSFPFESKIGKCDG